MTLIYLLTLLRWCLAKYRILRTLYEYCNGIFLCLDIAGLAFVYPVFVMLLMCLTLSWELRHEKEEGWPYSWASLSQKVGRETHEWIEAAMCVRCHSQGVWVSLDIHVYISFIHIYIYIISYYLYSIKIIV